MRVFFTFLFFCVLNSILMSQILIEGFETGLPTAYTSNTSFGLTSGTWTGQANGVIRGTTGVVQGSYVLQLRSQTGAQLTSPSIVSGGIGSITFFVSSSIASGAVQVNYSTDNGSTWLPAGGSPFTSISTVGSYKTATINNNSSNIIFQFYRTAGTIYIDDVEVNAGPMPVEFSKFTANQLDKSSILLFSTASETNNDYFTIERSADGRSYDVIGQIKGAGDSNRELSYEFIDENPTPGINYYRIKQTDFDGKYSYSEIRSVRHNLGKITVTPRNTDGRLTVFTDLDHYDLVVINSAGQEVQKFASLSFDQNIAIETLQAGIYFLRLTSGSESETLRIVKF